MALKRLPETQSLRHLAASSEPFHIVSPWLSLVIPVCLSKVPVVSGINRGVLAVVDHLLWCVEGNRALALTKNLLGRKGDTEWVLVAALVSQGLLEWRALEGVGLLVNIAVTQSLILLLWRLSGHGSQFLLNRVHDHLLVDLGLDLALTSDSLEVRRGVLTDLWGWRGDGQDWVALVVGCLACSRRLVESS
jgi:hypothetical protein